MAAAAEKDYELTKEKLADQYWRLNNLYCVVDEHGQKQPFKMNWAQDTLYRNMWYLDLILKARQYGMTSFILIYIVDTCLFNSNTAAGIIAHTQDKAREIFRDKVQTALDGLPQSIYDRLKPERASNREIVFANGSSIRVDTSHRSGTLQILHISEFGKIAAKYPDRAREIVTGALQTVHPGEKIFIESTAEGRDGYFYSFCKEAQNNQLQGKELTPLDYKFHFYPWWQHPGCVLSEPVTITQRFLDYFQRLYDEHGIELYESQKAWYVKTEALLGEDIKREYPSYAEEAFEASIEGAWFSREMSRVRADKRITTVRPQPNMPVDTWWDLGWNDKTAIWLTQTIGREIHAIAYYENHNEPLSHYARWLNEFAEKWGIFFGRHGFPHDVAVTELGSGKSRKETLEGLGIVVHEHNIAPQVGNKIDAIEAARNIIGFMWFDEERCDSGINALDNYRKVWDEQRATWKDHPLHDWASDGADALQTLSLLHQFPMEKRNAQARPIKAAPRGWT